MDPFRGATSDAELVRRACNEERSAMEQLVRRLTPRVLAVCRARVSRSDVAEDLAQETLLRGLRRLHTLEQPDQIGAWLRGIALRVCADWHRDPRNQGASLPIESESMSGLPDDRLESAELRDEVKMAMEELADDLREPIILFHYGEMTYEEIAELLGVSRATISARLAKARQQLARRLVHLMR